MNKALREEMKRLRAQENSYIRSARWCIRQGDYIGAVQNLHYASKAQIRREAAEMYAV